MINKLLTMTENASAVYKYGVRSGFPKCTNFLSIFLDVVVFFASVSLPALGPMDHRPWSMDHRPRTHGRKFFVSLRNHYQELFSSKTSLRGRHTRIK